MSGQVTSQSALNSQQKLSKGDYILGKRVGSDLYIHRDTLGALPSDFQERAKQASAITKVPLDQVSVIRFSLSENELSLLDYPRFFDDPFPCLARSWTVRLDDVGRVRFRSYADSLNPPILHRKELLLPRDDHRCSEMSQLTRDAEAIGLFQDPTVIGYRNAWERLIDAKGYRLEGSRFVPLSNATAIEHVSAPDPTAIARHLTALTRYNFSAPVQALSRSGFFSRDWTFFDYGCGKGDDVRGLLENGVNARGWDPFFAPEVITGPADIVNLGFVINVIEDIAERRETLRRAFELATRLLSVSVMLDTSANPSGRPYRDGFLTSRGTFQKYFTQPELKVFIDESLGKESLLVAPGIAFVFSDLEEEQRFLYGRQRSERSLLRLAARECAERSTPSIPAPKADVYLSHFARFSALWHRWLELGRVAMREEASDFADLFSAVGSFQRTCKILTDRQDQSLLASAREERMNDLRVYFALEGFSKRRPYRQLNQGIQRDVKGFFGTLKDCLEQGDALLRQIADTTEIEAACRSASEKGLGYYIPGESLILHSSLLPRLPPLLRVYVGAASALYGDASAADLIRIHVRSSKLTLLEFDSFQDSPVPELRRRVKIRMRSQEFDLFEYGEQYESTILLGKSKFINEEFPHYAEQLQFDLALKESNLFQWDGHGPTKSAFSRSLSTARRSIDGFHLVRATTIPSLEDQCGRNFRYRDLVQCGETQLKTGIPNVPREPESYNALYDLATEILDPTIDYFGMVKLTYGFASSELLKAIPGRTAPERDQHASAERNRSGKSICPRGGAAIDFLVEDEDMIEVARWIAENLPFDRLYVYGPKLPVHVSFGPEHSREIVWVERHGSRVIPRRLSSPTALIHAQS